MTDKRVLVTGSRGFLGTHLMRELEKDKEYLDYLIWWPSRSDLDLLDANSVLNFLQQNQIDTVIHLAARCGGIGVNQQKPGEFLYQNLMMTANLIEASRWAGVKKFVGLGTVCFDETCFVKTGNRYSSIAQLSSRSLIVTRHQSESQVIDTFQKTYTGDLYHIRPYGAETLKTTPEHPFLVLRDDNEIWIEAQDLKDEDLLVIPLHQSKTVYKPHIEFIQLDEGYPTCNLPNQRIGVLPKRFRVDDDFAYLCGWYLAEGSLSSNGIDFSFGDEPEQLQKIQKILDRLNIGYGTKKYIDQKGWQIGAYSVQLKEFFKEHFYSDHEIHRSDTKRIPDFIFTWPRFYVEEFLRGYFLGDGHFEPEKRGKNKHLKSLQAGTTSRCLVYQLRDLLLRYEIFGNIHYKPAPQNSMIGNRRINAKDSWTVKFTGTNRNKIIKLLFPQYRDRLPVRTYTLRKVYFSENRVYVPIYPIKKAKAKNLQVFNLHTIDETYTANGVIVHNCSYPVRPLVIPFKEDDLYSGYPEETNAPYGLAKRMQLEQLRAYRKQYGFNGIFLIPVNMAGEFDHFDDDRSHVIPALIKKFHVAKLNKDSQVTLWGTGSATREFLYAGDCARAIGLAMKNHDSPDPVNIGTGKEISIRDLATKIKDLVGYEGEIVWDDTKPDGQPRRCLDVSRAKQAFGFEAQTSLDEILNRTYQWAVGSKIL